MSFYDEVYLKYKTLDFAAAFKKVSRGNVEVTLGLDRLKEDNLIALLSPAAENYLEEMAQKAQGITLRHFGRTIQLYTPIYLSDYCDNQCVYCGFNAQNNSPRKKLSLEDVRKEAEYIHSTGLKHILVLTGESRQMSPVSYIKDCVGILREYFSSISIEIYALSEEEYRELIAEGVDGLTIYQETYNEETYNSVHLAGNKKDYQFRLSAPRRSASAGMYSVNIGALLGLYDWRSEVFFLGLHAKYLQDNFSGVEVGAAIPRIRPQGVNFRVPYPVTDKNVVQIITALRIFIPRLNITVSTRESAEFRDNLLGLGITRMSAGSTTCVGGHTLGNEHSQFEISDSRDVAEIKLMLERKGYQAVLKDWVGAA